MTFKLFNRRCKISRLIPGYLNIPLRLSILFTALVSLITLVVLPRLQPVIPIFYSLARPEQHLASKEWLVLFPVVSTWITIGHLSLVKFFRFLEPTLLKLFVWATIFLQFILLLVFLRIVLIV